MDVFEGVIVFVGVLVGVEVLDGVIVCVGVTEGVIVLVGVDVVVGVTGGVYPGVTVGVGVGVGEGIKSESTTLNLPPFMTKFPLLTLIAIGKKGLCIQNSNPIRCTY